MTRTSVSWPCDPRRWFSSVFILFTCGCRTLHPAAVWLRETGAVLMFRTFMVVVHVDFSSGLCAGCSFLPFFFLGFCVCFSCFALTGIGHHYICSYFKVKWLNVEFLLTWLSCKVYSVVSATGCFTVNNIFTYFSTLRPIYANSQYEAFAINKHQLQLWSDWSRFMSGSKTSHRVDRTLVFMWHLKSVIKV